MELNFNSFLANYSGLFSLKIPGNLHIPLKNLLFLEEPTYLQKGVTYIHTYIQSDRQTRQTDRQNVHTVRHLYLHSFMLTSIYKFIHPSIHPSFMSIYLQLHAAVPHSDMFWFFLNGTDAQNKRPKKVFPLCRN